MRIFIDTNKYLDFFRASDNSLETLNSLISLIESHKLSLILPEQVISEFKRDREQVFKNFDASLKTIDAPNIIREDNDIKTINELIKKKKKEYKDKMFDPESEINIALKKVFSLAEKPIENDKILGTAYYRTLRGNPPRKDNRSFGDAIIWETILEYYTDNSLIIISRDGDWSSEINKEEINPFLLEEWLSKTKNNLRLENNLAKVINSLTKDKKLDVTIIEEEDLLSTTNPVTGASYNNLRLVNPDIFSPSLSLVNPPYGLYNVISSTPSMDGYNHSQICSCCKRPYANDSLDSPNLRLMGTGKCEDCKGTDYSLQAPRECKGCGKHLHESFSSTKAIIEEYCQDCRENKEA